MRKNAVGTNELANIISATNSRVIKSEAREWINIVFDAIERSLLLGENVRIKNFGTFSRRKHRAMNGYNPHTGGRIDIAERKSVAFVPAEAFKDKLNGR